MYLSPGICPKKNAAEIIFFTEIFTVRKKSALETGFFPLKILKKYIWTAGDQEEADKKLMVSQTTFKQILRDKMGTDPADSNHNDSTCQAFDLSNMAYLLGKVGRLDLNSPRGHYPAPKVRPQRKAHIFSESQKYAFDFFKLWSNNLNDNFSEAELKKAFRQIVLVLHPDRGGNSADFLNLKMHYDDLRSLVIK